jgi:EmrB/QacA subfamily drug resistance transporter
MIAKPENSSVKGVSKRAVLLIAAMSAFLAPLTASSVNIALPSIDKEFSLNAVELNWVATAYLLSAAMLIVPFGRIADIFGRKRIFVIGLVIYAIISFLCVTPNSGLWLIILRALQGVGSAMIFGTGTAILTSVYPPKERGRALGINAASVYVGLSLGPLIGGFLTTSLGWRSIFLLTGFLGLIILMIVFLKLKSDWAEAKGEKFDYLGSIIYSLSLLVIMYGFSVLPDLVGIWLVLIGIIGFAAFVFLEHKQKYPVLNLSLFRNNTAFFFSNLAALINYSATFAVGFLLSLYLQYIKGFDVEHAGIILIAQPVLMVICSPIAGSISDKIQPRIVATTGMAMTTCGLILLTFLDNNSSLIYVLISQVILGLGFGLFSSPNTNAVMSSLERKYYGVGSGILGTTRLFGQTLSMGIVLMLFALYIGQVQITPESYPLFLKSMKMAFIISAALCFIGIFASFARGKFIRDT